MSNSDLREVLDLLDEIVLAGMSGTGMESQEEMDAFHARQAWRFISIAAKAKEKLEALAASKPEPQAPLPPNEQFYRDSLHAAAIERSKPEPQAQAGEPEVVAVTEDNGNIGATKYGCETLYVGDKLITLQSHREAMTDAAAIAYALESETQDNAKLREAIAKRDAALKAQTEALEEYKKAGLGNSTNFEIQLCAARLGTAAIKQAQEAQR